MLPEHLALLDQVAHLHRQLDQIAGQVGADLHGGGRLHLAGAGDGSGDGPLAAPCRAAPRAAGGGRSLRPATVMAPTASTMTAAISIFHHVMAFSTVPPTTRSSAARATATSALPCKTPSCACVNLICALRTSRREPAPAEKRSVLELQLLLRRRAGCARRSASTCDLDRRRVCRRAPQLGLEVDERLAAPGRARVSPPLAPGRPWRRL